MHVQQIWHPEHIASSELFEALSLSLTSGKYSELLRGYATKNGAPAPKQPIHIHNGNLTGAAYHHGHQYLVYTCGDPAITLEHCTMSENEREHAAIEYLHLKGIGLTVVAVASGTASQPNQLPKLTLMGYIGISI